MGRETRNLFFGIAPLKRKKNERTVFLAKKTCFFRLDNAFDDKPKGGALLGYQTNTRSLNAVFEGLEM